MPPIVNDWSEAKIYCKVLLSTLSLIVINRIRLCSVVKALDAADALLKVGEVQEAVGPSRRLQTFSVKSILLAYAKYSNKAITFFFLSRKCK